MFVYSLYHCKESARLEIRPRTDKFILSKEEKEIILKDGILYYNNNLYLASDRKLLRAKAKEIKEGWIEEVQSMYNKILNAQVITKYR